ncbi:MULTISPECIES: replication initiation factor domain-containing protein [Leptospira]|uniref:Replication initiation factor n=1 Tax=Leptospira weilii str. 2006001855 TaxID=996804 RepID=M6FFY1_9LEPT|nr:MULTISPECIES: replication initiation factor domain-containing protein [Leptospira]EMJ60571.1 replication initiation factor [Leptospira sp. P2653]EMM71693.1 replication initiation factor [Leptospira weilii str. 2006001855]MDL5247529.1 replication initiation factor domain-containing protein [Leptospira weilii]
MDQTIEPWNISVPQDLKKPFVDWLAFSIEYSAESWEWLKRVFGELNVEEKGTGTGHTHRFRTSGGVFGAFSPERRMHKIHISMSSKALFNFRSSPLSLAELIKDAIELRGKFTRIDLALDDYEGFLNLPHIYEKLNRKEVATRFRNFSKYEAPIQSVESGTLFKDSKFGKHGYTIYIGSFGKSNSFVRIYDKKLQVGPECAWPIWNRLEFQLNHQAADQYCNPTWNVDPETGEILNSSEKFSDPRRAKFENRSFPKTAFYYLKFLDPCYKHRVDDLGNVHLDEIHKRYWPVCTWWTKFLRTAEGEWIGLPKNETGLEDIDNWLRTQTSGAMYLLTEVYGEDYLDEILEEGKEKFESNKKYQNLLKQSQETQKKSKTELKNEVPF